MGPRTARALVALFFALDLVVLSWPGVLPFNRVRPFVAGLPFVFFWVALWAALGGVALWLLDRYEHGAGARTRAGESDHARSSPREG
jgi:hypothetical protein